MKNLTKILISLVIISPFSISCVAPASRVYETKQGELRVNANATYKKNSTGYLTLITKNNDKIVYEFLLNDSSLVSVNVNGKKYGPKNEKPFTQAKKNLQNYFKEMKTQDETVPELDSDKSFWKSLFE